MTPPLEILACSPDFPNLAHISLAYTKLARMDSCDSQSIPVFIFRNRKLYGLYKMQLANASLCGPERHVI